MRQLQIAPTLGVSGKFQSGTVHGIYDLAELNSTPVLVGAFILITCLQTLRLSYKWSVAQRDTKGKVRRMEVSIGGRLAASLAATYSILVGNVKRSGGSG